MACLLPGALHGHGAYDEVAASLRDELIAAPDDAALHFKLAEAHAGHEEWRLCLPELEVIERLAPGQFPTAYLRGLSLHIAGKNDEAKAVLDSFIADHPKHGDALATRGRVLMVLKQPAEAAKDFQNAFDLAVSPAAELILDLAEAYARSDEPEKASRVIDKGLSIVGDTPSLLEYALALESARGDWNAALARIDALQKAAPRPETWMARRAQILSKAGRSSEATAVWSGLRGHLLSLPTLERAYPQNADLLRHACQALGESAPQPVFAPPSPHK